MSAVDDLILISVDDHVIEPPDLFAGHLTGDYLERAPKLVRNEAGNDVWTFGDAVIENPALNAVAGRPLEEYGLEPQSLEEIRPGCYDVDERVKDMDAGGVLASMNFPSFPTFTARLFATDDVDLLPRPRAGLQRLAHRRVVRGPPRALHPDGGPRHLGPPAHRRRGAPVRRQGVSLAHLHREPRRPGLPELPRRVLGPAVAVPL